MLMTLEKSQNFTYYAGIMLDAFAMHNWLKPIVVNPPPRKADQLSLAMGDMLCKLLANVCSYKLG